MLVMKCLGFLNIFLAFELHKIVLTVYDVVARHRFVRKMDNCSDR